METPTGAEWAKRDDLACRFMQAILEGHPGSEPGMAEEYARKAYMFADGFLAVRARGGK